jgi:hypothetical protein
VAAGFESVHCGRSGQVVQAAPKSAWPAWRGCSRTGRIRRLTWFGQFTVTVSRSMSNWSLVNFPPGRPGLDLGLASIPAVCRCCSTSPAQKAELP